MLLTSRDARDVSIAQRRWEEVYRARTSCPPTTPEPATPEPGRRGAAAACRSVLSFIFIPIRIFLLSFVVAPTILPAVTITEVNYHPSEAEEAALGTDRSLEWIELYNPDAAVVNLSGWRFSNGVAFTFPPDTYLEGRSYLVVCADEAAVRAKYGITNTIGNFQGRLNNDGEAIELDIFGGGPICRLEYNDRHPWPHTPDGTGHTLALRAPLLDLDRAASWAASPLPGGTPGRPNSEAPQVVETELVATGELWRYRKGTSPYPADWKESGFDDSGWLDGRTGIGYDDGDDATVLADMRNRYISFAARRILTLTQDRVDELDEVALELSYDDGFVFYINGVEIARAGLGPSGSFVPHNSGSEGHEGAGVFELFVFPRSILRAGENVLACQIHNSTIDSTDLSFVPRIISRRTIQPPAAAAPVPVVFNEVQFRGGPGSGWLELFNRSSSAAVDLSGFHLSDDRNDLGKLTLPAGSVVPPRGFLTVSEDDFALLFSGSSVNYYLTRPDLSSVVAGEIFANDETLADALAGRSEARLPDGEGRFFATATPTPGAANLVDLESRVVINEIFYHPPDEQESLEFLELHNPGGEAVDLGGFRLTRGVDFELPAGTTLAAGGYLVIARDPAALEDAHSISGVLGPYTGVLSNDGELLRLVDAAGNLADEVEYADGGEWSELADGGGSSLELLDPRQDNSAAAAWGASDEAPKSSWEEVSFNINYSQQDESEFQIRMLVAGECLVDSISVTRNGTEHIRNGGFESNTQGWRIEGNHVQSHRTTEDAFAGSACLHVVATGGGDTRVNRIEQDTSPVMTSGTYTCRLAVRWLRGENLIHFSGRREPQGFQHSHSMSYPAALGSPGRRNSIAVANLGPVASGVAHGPAVPSGAQNVTVRARISDADGVTAASVRYRLGAAGGPFLRAALFDDGDHGDGGPQDGEYAGSVPGQGNGSRVVFYIEAEDGEGARRTFPPEAPERTLVYVHDSPLIARSHAARLIFDDARWSELTSRQLHSEEGLPATFIFDESTVYYNIGARYRGSPWQRPGSPRMYNLDFAKDNELRSPHGSLRSINLSRYGAAQRENASYYSVWRNSTASTTSPRSRSFYSRVRTNDGTYTMELIEPINKGYLGLWFPGDDDGTLMKITGKVMFDDDGNFQGHLTEWASWDYRGPSTAGYRWRFNLRTREASDDYSQLVALVQKMSASPSALDQDLETVMDVEQFLRVYAARCAHDDWDTIGIGNGQNAYTYFAAIEGRWKLLPWDLDNTWGNAGARTFPDADSRMANIMARPRFRRLYLGIVNEMLNGRGGEPGYWSEPEMVVKYLDRVTRAVGSDGVAAAGDVRNFIRQRRTTLAALIPGRVSFEITTNGGRPHAVDASAVTIEGNAWVDVHDIVVNGEIAELTWPTVGRWRTSVPLEAGRNELAFLAFDADGTFLASDTIEVTSSVGWAAPVISGIEPASAMPGERVTIRGQDLHDGIRVFFAGVESDEVRFDEAADPDSLTAAVPLLAPGLADVVVRNTDDRSSRAVAFTVLELPPVFVRGDVNLDEILDLSDPIRTLGFLFGDLDAPCRDAADFDDDEAISIADAVAELDYLFRLGPPPAAPYPDRGREPDAEGPLGCDSGLPALGP